MAAYDAARPSSSRGSTAAKRSNCTAPAHRWKVWRKRGRTHRDVKRRAWTATFLTLHGPVDEPSRDLIAAAARIQIMKGWL